MYKFIMLRFIIPSHDINNISNSGSDSDADGSGGWLSSWRIGINASGQYEIFNIARA